MGFVIHGPGETPIGSVAEWERLAAPAGKGRHWVDDRSAKELAVRWVSGKVPEEVRAVLESHAAFRDFLPTGAWAEHKTALDEYGGNTRNHDLLVVGTCGDEKAIVDVEGKADESFGSLVGKQLERARTAEREKPGSKAARRVEELCRAVLGVRPEEARDVRYQLVYGVAAAVIAAKERQAKRAAWIVHEFVSGGLSAHALKRNARDLAAFVGRLSGEGGLMEVAPGRLLGPWRLPGGERVSSEVELYMGKARLEKVVPEPGGLRAVRLG